MLQNHISPYDNFIIIGDPHLRYRHSSNSDLDYRGIQPLTFTLGAISEALTKADINNCPAYIAGDLFDRANFNHVETASIIKLFDKVACPIYIIRGNHDTSLVHKWGEPYPKNHILYVLEEACPNVQIFHTDYQNKKKHIFVKHLTEFESKAYVLYTLPYMESETSFIQALEDIKQDAKETENHLNTTLNDDRAYGVEPLLICHQSIDPLVPDVTVNPEHFKGFKRVWNGHLHERAYLGNPTSSTSEQIRILGSLTFQTLSDKGKPTKGYYHIHLGEKLEEEFIELNQPQIIECKEGEKPKNDFDYVHWIRTQNNAVTQSEEVFTEVDDVSKDGRKTLIQDFLSYSDNKQKEVEEILLDLISEGASMSDQGFKEIHFKEIRMEGFLSYVGKESYDLQYPGKSYIHGLEGSGKSNILKALTWVLTGSYWNRKKKFTDPTSYETYANQVDNFSGCRVELDLEINEEPYTIVRTHGRYKGDVYGENMPKGIALIQQGKHISFDEMEGFEDITQTLKRNNAKLLQFLGLSINDIIYTLTIRPEYIDLISADQAEARDIFDSMIGADWVDGMRAKADERYNQVLQDIAIKQSELLESHNRVKSDEDYADTVLKAHITKQEKYAQRVDELTKSKKQLSDQEKELKSKIKELEESVKILQANCPAVPDKEDLTKKKAAISMSLSILKGSILDHQKVEEELEIKSQRIHGVISEIEKLEKELLKHIEDESDISDNLEELDDYIPDVPLSEMEDQLTQCKSDLALAKMTHSKLTQDLASNMTEIQNVEKSLSDLNEGKTTHCSLCNQPLPEDQIETSRKNLKEKLEGLKKEQEAIKQNLQVEMDLESSLSYSIEDLTGKISNEKQRLNKQSNLESSLKSLALDKKKVEGSIELKRDEKDLLFITKEQLESKVKEFNRGKSKLDSQIKEQENQLNLIQQELDSVEELEKKARDYVKETINPLTDKLTSLQTNLESVLQFLGNYKAELKVLKDNAPGEFPENWDSLQEKLNKAKTKVIEIEGVISSLNQRLNSLTIIRSKVLNPKGLKPFVIGKKLTQINHYCAQYSSIVKNQLQVSVDDKGNYNFIVSFDGIERDGGSLSTGWTFHANMTLLGALTKEREKKTKVNCLFIDEPFATIPESSVQKVTDMIEAVGEGKSIHIITHSQMLDVTMAREVRIEGGLVNGIEIPSRIEI